MAQVVWLDSFATLPRTNSLRIEDKLHIYAALGVDLREAQLVSKPRTSRLGPLIITTNNGQLNRSLGHEYTACM